MTANVSLTISIDRAQSRPFLLDRFVRGYKFQEPRHANRPCDQYPNQLRAFAAWNYIGTLRYTVVRFSTATTNINIQMIWIS